MFTLQNPTNFFSALTLFKRCGGNETVHGSGAPPPRTQNFLKEHLEQVFWKWEAATNTFLVKNKKKYSWQPFFCERYKKYSWQPLVFRGSLSWKRFVHEVFFEKVSCSWRGAWPVNHFNSYCIFGVDVVGQCGGIPVRYSLIRIGVLSQSHRIRICSVQFSSGLSTWQVATTLQIATNKKSKTATELHRGVTWNLHS